MKRDMPFPFVLILTLLAGCSGITGPSSVSPILLVDEEVVDSGDRMTIRLVNASDREIGYNLCEALLERQDGTRWHVAEQGRTCFGILYVLRPGGQAAESRVLPPETGPGVYRFRLSVRPDTRRQGPDLVIWSSEFEVR
jgi:hypothetical protein